MKLTGYVILTLFVCCTPVASGQVVSGEITLEQAVDSLSLLSSTAEIEKLDYRNELLQFENYKKSLLPALSLSFDPLNFNRSLQVLQEPADGSYTYVEDFSNNSSAGISIRQKIGITGGELTVGSNLNYLNEFSRKRNSFSTTPFTIGYSQQLWGGGKSFRLEKEIEHARNRIAIRQYCSNIAEIQQQALALYLAALLNKMEREWGLQTKHNNDTLLYIAQVKLDKGHITEYDFKQIELQAIHEQYAYENAVKNYVESRQRLLTFLGIDEVVEVAIPDFHVPVVIDPHTATYYVKKNNPFSKQQEIKRLEAEKNLLSAKLSNRFNGNIRLNYGVNQYAETFVEAYRRGNTRQSVVIGFQIPLFQWGINKNKIQMAENNYRVSHLSFEKSIRDFENEIMEKINTYNHSVKLWFTAKRAYELSQEQYEMLVKKFALGKVSVYELTTMQNDQNDAMLRYYSAIRDSYDSYFSLRSMALYDFKTGKELEELFISE